ncbi:MAG: hypothetical protein JWM16_458 [Verrucomicrobiales bacterium]|nr:hypothetical protein [Verrucomicrobiales bacterium]
MNSFFHSDTFHIIAQILIGSVWVFHGLYSKILNGIPRHRLIVGKILGAANAGLATKAIGLLEVLLGIWAFTGWQPVDCAGVQSAAIVAMNTLGMWHRLRGARIIAYLTVGHTRGGDNHGYYIPPPIGVESLQGRAW